MQPFQGCSPGSIPGECICAGKLLQICSLSIISLIITMRLVRSKVPLHTSYIYNKPITSITRIWADDGWCYIPELKIRQKFVIIPKHIQEVEFLSESWSGYVPNARNIEKLSYYKHSPMVWEELGGFGIDRYEEKTDSITSY